MDTIQTIETEITFKTGSRPQLPAGSGYAPHFIVMGDSTWLGVRFLNFPTDAEFGKPCQVTVELLYPDKVDYHSLSNGSDFEVREGGNVVATGRVLKGK